MALEPWSRRGQVWLVAALALVAMSILESSPPERRRARPEGGSGHWAYRPLRRPAVPEVKDRSWVRNPIDAFVLARLEEKGLSPSAPAGPRALIRRVHFDLIGLPPTPEEVEAFAADASDEAYARIVERLLASPRHGERWARHWMDLVHFAETHGHDQDRPRPNAWPYRDYLIRSFNEDKPYARFVEEQIAGDVLYPDDPQGVVALGFIAAGPWDESSQLNIVDDTVDKKIARNLDRDDMVTTALATFTSTTVHCARCHDHKFDPVTQEEYYSLQAVFAGVDRADRPYDLDPEVHRLRRSLLAERAALESGTDPSDAALLASSAVEGQVEAWEREQASREGIWTVLHPESVASAGGASAAKLPDGSVLFGGARPEVDTYTFTAHTDLRRLTALRLEVLTHESLPHQGAGRQDNGNLHLSEVQLHAARAVDAGAKQPVPLVNASADFDQQGWTAAMAIDGKLETAWGIYPEVGKPHQAVFEIREPSILEGGTVLTVVLEQKHGKGHLIGRPRLSATAAPRPVRAVPVPAPVAAVLAVPRGGRSDAQRLKLARHVLLEEVERKLAALPPSRKVYAAASDFPSEGNFTPAKAPRPIHVLARGDVSRPGPPAAPGALGCVEGLEPRFDLPRPEDEGSRRAALARWITDPGNALTWRSIANRIWHHHFGRGLVDTPNDFGRMGGRPSHPELLDWLAAALLESGGSLKRLHRLITASATFRQSSLERPECVRVDSDNRLLWRMHSSRLDAESIRDAVLQISGKLDLVMGGPSVKQFVESPGIHVTPTVDYLGFDVDRPESFRRSVYRFLFRTLPDPFMDTLDCADASQLTPARSSSVTALQALALLNNRFLVRQCEHFAARLAAAQPTPERRIREAYLLALGRPPSEAEAAALRAYAERHGLANACRLILNMNEFIFVQ